MNSEGFHICVFSMSGWAVFPYQHTSPLWGEVQLSILCTGSQTGGLTQIKTHWALAGRRAPISELAVLPVILSLHSQLPKPRGISPQDQLEMLRGHWGSSCGHRLLFPDHPSIPPTAECPAQPQAQPCQGYPAQFLQLEQPLALQPSKHS